MDKFRCKLFTVGHSRHTLEMFLSFLNKYNINCLIDVRSLPYSKIAPQFNKDKLKFFLKTNNIIYIHMGTEFGARQENKSLYTSDGYLDFEKVSKQEFFIKAVEKITEDLEKGYIIAFMCSEKDPFNCHRAILVARAFYEKGYNVQHIMENGDLLSHKELEERLIDYYFPDRRQLSFFSRLEQLDEEYLVKEAYKKRNKDIGYCLENGV